MRRTRLTEEQIIGVLKEAEAGRKVAELCRTHGCLNAPERQGDVLEAAEPALLIGLSRRTPCGASVPRSASSGRSNVRMAEQGGQPS